MKFVFLGRYRKSDFSQFFPDFLYKTIMGDPFFGGGGPEEANKNKIGPKTSKSARKSEKSDFFF